MSQLIGVVPTSRALSLEKSPRSVAWVDIMEDLSGLKVKEDGWVVLEEVHESLHDIFKEIARGYLPAMIVNAKAISSNEVNLSIYLSNESFLAPGLAALIASAAATT